MGTEPYSDKKNQELVLRDVLALDRTVLANERTFLAFIRTALAIVIVGATLIHFFENAILQIAGWLFLPVGIGILVAGFLRYRKFSKRIRHFKDMV